MVEKTTQMPVHTDVLINIDSRLYKAKMTTISATYQVQRKKYTAIPENWSHVSKTIPHFSNTPVTTQTKPNELHLHQPKPNNSISSELQVKPPGPSS
eukprot:TRINITY_DN8951_c0_g1_i1.p1 TRINITY_DN8951_c0_g1~~TRINITY_DN8951_c0_g1_i1.p1  ORF type:complete len:105 (+),score=9.59 TRINITY_DN8951_c0_g1_i1:25-315(+)